MNELALFAGAGGGILGSHLLGWRTVCAVELDEYARRVLLARQDDGCLPPFPIWDDIRTFNGKPWAGRVDIVTGGFPCQDVSVAGKGAGITGAKSGLWKEMARVIGEVRPRFALVENSPMLTSRGLGTVLGDLAALGFDAKWGVLGAYHAGGYIKRERLWIVAGAIGGRLEGREHCAAFDDRTIQGGPIAALEQDSPRVDVSNPRAFGSPNVVANRMDRLRCIGNGQVPSVVRLAWETLT